MITANTISGFCKSVLLYFIHHLPAPPINAYAVDDPLVDLNPVCGYRLLIKV